MICLYLVNEEPSYIGMVSFSLGQLRKYNSSISVVVYFVCDGCRDSRKVDGVNICRVLGDYPSDYESFKRYCDGLNVEVRVREPVREDYFSLHRLVLCEVVEDSVLLLDGDTFISGDVGVLFGDYVGCDFVATPNNWGMINSVPGLDSDFRSFNSGVVLCRNGVFKRWMDTVGDYCDKLRDGDHYLSSWLWGVSENCVGREELAASLFVLDNGISYGYFRDEHVQMGKCVGGYLIFHTLTPNWLKYYNEYFGVKKRVKLFKYLYGKRN